MAWQLKGTWVEACSCKANCRCVLGPTEPDQGWCNGAWVLRVESGRSDGLDLSGVNVAIHVQLPGDFFGGIELARLYFDEAVTPEQQRELSAIFMGDKGGVWDAMKGVIAKWLPPVVTTVEIDPGDPPSYTVGDYGIGRLERLKTEAGNQVKIIDPPVPALFGMNEMQLARADPISGWSDPDMRQWRSLGAGHILPFNWSG